MNCVAVSDFHMHDVNTPAADLLVIGGDMTFRGTNSELRWFSDWLKRQPQKHKVWIAGNHELGIEDDPERAVKIAKETNTIYLNDSFVEIEGAKIWGSPVTPWFQDWAYNRHRGEEIRRHWDAIPEGLDILITHGPPFGYLDQINDDLKVGCEELLKVLNDELKKPPRFHVFGHIHEGYGRETLLRPDGQSIELINASICDGRYQNAHPPTMFDL